MTNKEDIIKRDCLFQIIKNYFTLYKIDKKSYNIIGILKFMDQYINYNMPSEDGLLENEIIQTIFNHIALLKILRDTLKKKLDLMMKNVNYYVLI